MKLFGAILFFALATIAFAQSVQIGYPHKNQKIHAGKKTTVQIVQPDSIMGSLTLGIAIGIQACTPQPCMAPSQSMAYTLYNGAFSPQRHGPEANGQPYQNFTVDIPSWLNHGTAQLSVAYAALWGAANYPSFQFDNENVIVV